METRLAIAIAKEQAAIDRHAALTRKLWKSLAWAAGSAVVLIGGLEATAHHASDEVGRPLTIGGALGTMAGLARGRQHIMGRLVADDQRQRAVKEMTAALSDPQPELPFES